MKSGNHLVKILGGKGGLEVGGKGGLEGKGGGRKRDGVLIILIFRVFFIYVFRHDVCMVFIIVKVLIRNSFYFF